jgi:hypothetical protein
VAPAASTRLRVNRWESSCSKGVASGVLVMVRGMVLTRAA